MLLTVPSPFSQSLCKIPFLPLPNNSYSTRNRPSTLITALEDAKITRISSSYSSSSVEDPKRMRRRKRNPDRNPSPLETRIALVLALASQAASLSQRVLSDLATESAKYVFPKRFESRNLEEALMSVPDLETVKFKVLKREEEYEIRQVETYFVAEMTMPGKSGFDFNGASQGFNVLAAYLFGKNTANETMEMTTPVYTQKTQSDGEKMEMTTPVITKQSGDLGSWQMSFVMPSKYGAKLPLPKDPSVRITEVPGKIVAVAAFSGYFLNPEFYYRNVELHTEAIDTDLRVGLREVLKRLLSADDQVDAMQEISIYTQRKGTFADLLVIRSIGRMPPADWWMNFGESAPHLRGAAVRILSQTTTSSNCERNWSTFSLIHTKARNRLTMQKLNKLVYCHYNLKLRNRIRERRARDDPAYCPINLDHIFREDDPLLPWLAEIEDPVLDSDPGFQQTVQELIDEDIGEAPAEGQPPQGEGATTSRTRRSGKDPASEKTSSTTVSSSSHGGGDGGGGGDSGTGGTSEYYQHDEDDVIPVEEVQELPPSGRFDPSRGYQRRRRDSPPGAGGSSEQGNMGGDVGGQQAASWTDSWNPSHSGQGPSQYFDYFPYGQVQQGEEQSSASGSYSYGDYGETQYGRNLPPPPPSSYDVGPAGFFGFVDPNAHQYQIQYGANRNDNNDGDEDNHSPLNLGRHSFWW